MAIHLSNHALALLHHCVSSIVWLALLGLSAFAAVRQLAVEDGQVGDDATNRG